MSTPATHLSQGGDGKKNRAGRAQTSASCAKHPLPPKKQQHQLRQKINTTNNNKHDTTNANTIKTTNYNNNTTITNTTKFTYTTTVTNTMKTTTNNNNTNTTITGAW